MRALLSGVVAVLALASPASAFTPPEVFVRLQYWDRGESPDNVPGAWVPLTAAPRFGDLRGYQIGYRLQASGKPNELQRAALTVTAAPDGQPTQPSNEPPFCVTQIGAVGEIVPVGRPLQFEGNGTYSVSVAVGDEAGGGSGCLTGHATSGSFAVDVHVALERVGDPFVYRTKPLPGDPFVGVRAQPPPGGSAQVRCALDATVGADGEPRGRLTRGQIEFLPEDGFDEPGAWTCAARGVREGSAPDHTSTEYGTPWSAPQAFDVRTDFRRVGGAILNAKAARPRFEVKARFPAAAAGGRVTLTLRRFVRCRGKRAVTGKAQRYRGTFDGKRALISFTRPRRPGFYVGTLAFAGTRFTRAGNDTRPIELGAERRVIDFVRPGSLTC